MRKSRQPRCTAANFAAGRREVAEAAGINPEFALSDSQRRVSGDPDARCYAIPHGSMLSKSRVKPAPGKQATGAAAA